MDSPETTKEWDTTRIEHGSQEKNTYEKVRASVQTDYAGAHAKVDPAEIKLVRKLDTWITPTLCLMYFLNYLDRNAIALAPLDGMKEDLHLKGTEYQTAISIMYVGYLLGQVPSNMIITRRMVRPSLYISGCMVIWSIVSTLSCLVTDFKSIVICRFFLGLAEAPFIPAAMYLLSIFYTRKELATRLALLIAGGVLSTAFAGLLALAVFNLGGTAGLEGWRWLFLITGLTTFVVAIGSAFTLPDNPLTTRWLTPEERRLAHDRVQRDVVERREGSGSVKGLIEAAKDGKLWLFIVMMHAEKVTLSFKNFLPQVVKTLGFDRTITLVLTCPPYLLAVAGMIAWGRSSGHFNERTWHTVTGKVIATFGFVLAVVTMNTGARYFAIFCFVGATNAIDGIMFGWVASTCGQTHEKRASSLALANAISTSAAIWSPYLYTDPPRYTIPMATNAGLSVLVAICALLMQWVLKRENRKLRERDPDTTVLYAY